jgi:hypothetical protein
MVKILVYCVTYQKINLFAFIFYKYAIYVYISHRLYLYTICDLPYLHYFIFKVGGCV